jgi:pimeloyl-ACP methyl ester carboxylesterase
MGRCIPRMSAVVLASLLALGNRGTAAQPLTDPQLGGKTGRKPLPPPLADLVEARFIQVYPWVADPAAFRRSPNQPRAVVLIHGLQPHPFRTGEVGKADFRSWQLPGSHLVETLGRLADVFAFAYSQNVAVEEIPGVPALLDGVRLLRQLGYSEVVLVGHSAGGLIARQFVEDYPSAGVTKVIQVCAPNAGAGMAQLEPGVTRSQRVFLHSLTKAARADCLGRRVGKQIPTGLQFVCLVGDGAGLGDGVVSKESQWPPDLQAQGIPAVLARTTHFTVMHSSAEARQLAELIRQDYPRWDPAQVARVKKELRNQVPRILPTPLLRGESH